MYLCAVVKNLRVTLIQAQLHWENTEANLDMFSNLIAPLQQTDLIVLPEMFCTGFTMNAPAFAQGMDGRAVKWMRKTAAEKNCVVCGSLIIADNARFYNRLVWMQPDGAYESYDKRHLFSLSNEPSVFSAGTERLIVLLKGWRICPLICYDLRFPVWSRNKIEHSSDMPAYDVLLYVANWPERRNFAWQSLLVARAIENQAYVIGVNRVGEDGSGIAHSGDSMVADALGKTLYTKAGQEDIFTIELSAADLNGVRQQLPFLKSADDFEINAKTKIKSH